MLDFWLLNARILIFYIFISLMIMEVKVEQIGEIGEQKILLNGVGVLNKMRSFNKKLSVEDQKLYELCKKFGSQALSARRKFAGLLPEVFRRRLYQKKGFKSIFEFAAKLAGMSQDQVRVVLNLEKRFEDKPVLKSLLVNGEASVNKLARVVSIATVENQEVVADKILVLPKSALETWVRDERVAQCADGAAVSQSDGKYVSDGVVDTCQKGGDFENQNGLQESIFGGVSLPGQTLQMEVLQQPKLEMNLDSDVVRELNELHSKGIDVNELLRKMLDQRKVNIAQEKEKISKEIHEKMSVNDKNIPKNLSQKKRETNHAASVHAQNPKSTSRYIPVRIQKILKAEYGAKCSIHTCKKPSKQIHHTQRFSLSQNHDAKYLAPLCAEHHIIAHSIDVKFYRARQKFTE